MPTALISEYETKQEEFLNRNLRQALAYGINRKELVEKVQRGSGVVGSMGYLWKNSDWYNPDIPAYDYNPEKARELLKGQSYKFYPSYGQLR